MAFAPLIPTFVSELGLSYAAAGTIQTAYFWTYALVHVPVGMIADRWGTRRVMLASMALLVVGTVAFATAGGFGGAVLARMLVGLGAAAVWVPSMRLLSEWFPTAERARATGIVSAGGGIGGTVVLVPAVLAFVLIGALLRPGPRAIWPYNVTVFFSYGAYFSFLTFLPAFMVKVVGATPPQAGLITGLITAGTIVSWPLAGYLSDRLGRRKPIYLVSQVATGAICVVFAFAGSGLGMPAASAAAAITGLIVGGEILP